MAGEDFSREIETALEGGGEVSEADYLRWATRGDLPSQARAYALSAHAWSRIKPAPDGDAQCRLMASYLLTCLADDPPADGFVHTGHLAGYELSAWLKHLVTMGGTADVIRDVASRLADAYRAADEAGRLRIETAALEHIFETPGLRPFFDGWRRDRTLTGAHANALAWGLSHEEAPPRRSKPNSNS